jgi:hypothetical protein
VHQSAHVDVCLCFGPLEASRPLLGRSTKEMWRFELNSPCVCTNETVILIVDYLLLCVSAC